MSESSPNEKSLLSQTKELLQKYEMRAKKGLGQNFLVNSGILHKITQAADLSSRDLVMEVGPGMGVLTRQLLEQAGYLIAVELDNRMIELLQTSLNTYTNL